MVILLFLPFVGIVEIWFVKNGHFKVATSFSDVGPDPNSCVQNIFNLHIIRV